MEFIHYANGWSSLLCALGLSYIVLSPNIHEGFIVKLGLVAMILSLLATAALILRDVDGGRGLWNAGFVTRCGMLVVIAGYAMRLRAGKGQRRRRTDTPLIGG